MNRLVSILLVCLLHISLGFAATYNLQVAVTPSGAGSLNVSSGTYEEGSSIYLYTYNNTGFVFKGWYDDAGTLLSNATSFDFTMGPRDVAIQARYEYDPTAPENPAMPDTTTYYNLTTAVSPMGAGSVNMQEGKYAAQAQVWVSTYNNTGFVFTGWQNEAGELVSTDASFDYTMPNHDVHLTALYTYDPSAPANPDIIPPQYTVSLECKPQGSGSFNNTVITAGEGDNVHIYAYTNTGFDFLHWENEQGEILATERDFYYIMPHGDSKVYGVFEFNPSNPGNPNKNFWNQETGEVIVDDFAEGYLHSAISELINGAASSDVTMITVAGRINSNDFGIANYYSNCSLLDLSRVTGVTEIPSYAFDGTNLSSIYLPATIETIGYRAFANCVSLTSLICYSMTPPALESDVFDGVPEGLVVYVPAAALVQYQEDANWGGFTLLPIQEDIRSITVNLPASVQASDYAQMWLELINVKSGQRLHYVMTDKTKYIFNNVIRNTLWNVVVRNEKGNIFGKIENITIQDTNVDTTFAELSVPQKVILQVQTPDGEDVTSVVSVVWTDSVDNYLVQGSSVSGLPIGYKLSYQIILPQDLAMYYNIPAQESYTVVSESNVISYQLTPISKIQVSGHVKDAQTKQPITNAVVSASQVYAGKYTNVVTVQTDKDGNFTLEASTVPTTFVFSSANYIVQKLTNDTLATVGDSLTFEDICLKEISGATISVGFTYTPSVEEGDSVEIQNWYSDYNNIDYVIFNKTQQKSIEQFSVQYPKIVLLEEVADGDDLDITITSRKSVFAPVVASATLDTNQRADIVFPIIELGKIHAVYTTTANEKVVAMLYNSQGKLIKSYAYTDRELLISDLSDGVYTLVSMGSSNFFNTIYDLNQLLQTGLTLGVDYVQEQVDVQSGRISKITTSEIPVLDESKLYYTGDNTSFTVNKSSVVVGNYLTLTGKVDFRDVYANNVSNVKLIVDIPESCSFVENSVMVGNNISGYTLNGHQLTIPLNNYTERTRFCIIPTASGEYNPTAYVQFELEGKTILQPIGSVNYVAESQVLMVPAKTGNEVITVTGITIPHSNVYVYDNGVLVGETKSFANGNWKLIFKLPNVYTHSYHNVYAKVLTTNGLSLSTETKEVIYDVNYINLSKVNMIFSSYDVEYDFINPSNKIISYTYPHCGEDFTFLVNFTKNDTTQINDVKVNVLMMNKKVKTLSAEYNTTKGYWVAYGNFAQSDQLPISVSVDYEMLEMPIDNTQRKDEQYANMFAALDTLSNLIENEATIQVVEDTETRASFELLYGGTNGKHKVDIEMLDAAQFDLINDFILLTLNDTLSIYTKQEISDSVFSTIVVEENKQLAYRITMVDNEEIAVVKLKKSVKDLEKFLELQDNVVGFFETLTPFIAYMNGVDEYKYWVNRFPKDIDDLLSKRQEVFQLLMAKCPDGTYKLDEAEREDLYKRLQQYSDAISSFSDAGYQMLERWKTTLKCAFGFEAATLSFGKFLKAIPNAQIFLKNSKNAKYMRYLVKGGKKQREAAEDLIDDMYGDFLENAEFLEENGILDFSFMDYESVSKEFSTWVPESKRNIQNLLYSLEVDIDRLSEQCDEEANEKDARIGYDFYRPYVEPIIDPAGFVYEAVFSNRLEGVTATVYYKEIVQDMYGDFHENIVKWNAEDYAQENPLFTDANGYYRWDVPQGLWQVKFEKEGYETTYSEWLPVPPPQLEVNVAMKQNRQPEVKSARAFEDAVEFEFDKYMLPDLLTSENIIVMDGENVVEGTISLLDEEVSYEGQTTKFASKVRFSSNQPFTNGEISLLVSNRVESYAGVRMENDYLQNFTTETEVSRVVCDSAMMVYYGDSAQIVVSVLPAVASAGKTLTVQNPSSMILGVKEQQVVIDEEGKARVVVSGELLGKASLIFGVEGYNLQATTLVNIVQKPNLVTDSPTADIASGIVEKATELHLACTTAEAIIYYTIDGSDPTTNSLVYTGEPILINETMTIKVIAQASNMRASEILELNYVVLTYHALIYTVDGEIISTDSIQVGTPLLAQEQPAKEGYTFSGWSEIPEIMPANDVIISGTFTVNRYLLTYLVDGDTISTDSVEYNTPLVARADSVREGYTFSGWSEVPEKMPANDVVVSATFSINSYYLIYVVDGDTISNESVEYNTPIVAREEPTKEGYTFSGWSEIPATMPASNVTIVGEFIAPNRYNLTYIVDGDTISTESLTEGTLITAKEHPTKEGYTFSGWSEIPPTMPASDVTILGTFTVNSYQLIYKIDGDTISIENVEYGTQIVAKEAPVKEGCIFLGWSAIPPTMPAHDVVISGSFAPIKVKDVSLNVSRLELFVGETYQLVETVLPADAFNKNVSWETDNSEVASVEKGLVTALARGTTLITVVSEDGGYQAVCEVVVSDDTALENVASETQTVRKVLQDGVIYILHPDGKKYTTDGQIVK